MPELMPANGGTVLTKDVLFGMNVLTLGGFLVMGLSLTLRRTRFDAPKKGRRYSSTTTRPRSTEIA
jgi:hypothetical protein